MGHRPEEYPVPPPALRRNWGWSLTALGRAYLRRGGWRVEGAFPEAVKNVTIVAPHTSNWDFIIGVIAMFTLGIRGTFLSKDSLFRWPFGAVMRWLGGVPVDRFSPHNVVEQTIEYFRGREQVILALSPEGTRRKLPRWRTGFWYVAKGAGVPIVPVAFDFPSRTIRIFPPLMPGTGMEGDLARLGSLFDARMAKHPDQY